MMLILLKITEFAVFETLLVSIPESLGLLMFGIGLVALAVLIRTVLSRVDAGKADGEVTRKA